MASILEKMPDVVLKYAVQAERIQKGNVYKFITILFNILRSLFWKSKSTHCIINYEITISDINFVWLSSSICGLVIFSSTISHSV